MSQNRLRSPFARDRHRRAVALPLQVEAMERRQLLATIIVTTALDENNPADLTISLREAISLTNGTLAVADLNPLVQSQVIGTPSTSAQDSIEFAIPGIGLQTIFPTSALPAITHPVNINGYGQSGAAANVPENTDIDRAMLTVRIDGSLAGAAVNGLTINSRNSVVSGLEIVNFQGHGIEISGANSEGNWLFGNFIGTSTDPTNGRNFPTGLSNGQSGLYITSSNNRVGGNNPGLRNVIAGNQVGVTISGAGGTGNLLQNNYILDNVNQGVLVSSSNNTIGEALVGGGNIISGNGTQGVKVTGGPDVQGNLIVGNDIGTDMGVGTGATKRPKGLDPRPNGAEGILIENSPNNTIGSLIAAGKNVIAANQADGVLIQGAAATGNRLLNNWIGFNISNNLESLFIPNNFDGIHIKSANTLIGDGSVAGINVVANNRKHGIRLDGPGATGTQIRGNIIGLNPGGGSDFGNTLDGIHVEDAANNLIGGTNPGDRNTISGNNNGIVILNTGTFGPGAAAGNIIQGNFIGTGTDGVSDLGNAVDGIILRNAPRNTIGGDVSGAGNVIAGDNRGVRISGPGALGNLVQGNFIGTDQTGTAVIHNKIDGIIITDGASSNTIGGARPSAGNTIAFNVGNGIRVESGSDNVLLSNSIYSNTQLGINLVGGIEDPFGVTANSPGGPHVGANRLQNYPILTAVAPSGNSTFVQGTFSGTPNTSFTVQFFSSLAKELSGFGQGKTLLGTSTLMTDASGNATFALNVPVAVPSGQFVTATATDPTGNTSEFSNSMPSVPVTIQFGSPTFSIGEGAASATITITRSGGIGGAVAVSFATGGGTATAGSDYTPSSGSIFFNPGETIKTVTIPIADDQLLEANETIFLTLTNPTNGATLGSPDTAVLTIVDNEQSAVQFNAATFSVNERAGTATITVTRNSGVGTLTVGYLTSNGTAQAGTNYTSASGQLTFSAGQTTRTFTVPILNDNLASGDKVVNLTLVNPSQGILGAPSTAVLTIQDSGVVTPGGPTPNPNPGNPPTNPSPNPNRNQPGPLVRDFHLVVGTGGVTGILLTFSEPLDPVRARNVASYGFVVASAGSDGYLGTPDDFSVPLASATYNPASLQVLLTPATPLRLNSFTQLVINGNPSGTVGVTNANGDLLDGDSNGVNGGAYSAVFGAGNRFFYSDRNGDRVSLRLSQGGLMELRRGVDGEAHQLRLVQTVAGRSVLKGSVKRARTGDGRTSIGDLSGTAGVKIRLNRSIRVAKLSATSLQTPRGPYSL
ncbi:Calx-beta domain-containing protein [Singulisphaera sp. Ch08]|uniref:Calx-beta domain-containing protein n=1 Tax=Singulisphaera sp. Ch08 TaxID=3120278 RepID=A0AAU7CC13_9BACT